MANYTSLAAAMGRDDLFANLTATTGAAQGQIIIVDGEQMLQTGALVGNLAPVQRGRGGTYNVAHAILAPVLIGTPAEIQGTSPQTMNPLQPARRVISSIGADATLVYPSVDTVYFIDKASAIALTLSSPTPGTIDGVLATFYSNTDAAHIITYAPGLYGNGTTSDTATFAATKGASCTLMSAKGVVGVYALAAVTVG